MLRGPRKVLESTSKLSSTLWGIFWGLWGQDLDLLSPDLRGVHKMLQKCIIFLTFQRLNWIWDHPHFFPLAVRFHGCHFVSKSLHFVHVLGHRAVVGFAQ